MSTTPDSLPPRLVATPDPQTDEPAAAAPDDRPGGSLPNHLLVVLAVAQIVSGAFVSVWGDSPIMQADRPGEPPITPAGWAFSIWGVIELVSVLLAVWLVAFRLWAVRHHDESGLRVVDAVTRPLLVVFAGFTVWLVASVLEPVWATLVVFLVMGAALVVALRVVTRARAEIATWSPLGRFALWTTVGLYAGWSTVALWLNLTTALAFSGAPVTGAVGVAGQLAVLAGATATAVVVQRQTGGIGAYGLAVVWALAAAVIGAQGDGQPLLAVVGGVGLLVVVAASVLTIGLRRTPGRRQSVAG